MRSRYKVFPICLLVAAFFLSPAIASSEEAALFAYVANFFKGQLDIVDLKTNTITGHVPIGVTARYTTVTKDGSRAYVVKNMSSVVALDTKLKTPLWTLPLGSPIDFLILHNEEKHLYAVTFGSATYNGRLFVIDVETQAILSDTDLGIFFKQVALSENGQRLYLLRPSTRTVEGGIDVFDRETGTIIKTLTLLGSPAGMVMAADGTLLYTSSFEGLYSFDTTTLEQSHFLPIETLGANNLVIETKRPRLYMFAGGLPGVASAAVHVIDTAAHSEITAIPMDDAPSVAVIRSDEKFLYALIGGARIKVIDTASNQITATIEDLNASWFSLAVFAVVDNRTPVAPMNFRLLST